MGLNAFQTYLQHLLSKEVKKVQENSRPDSKKHNTNMLQSKYHVEKNVVNCFWRNWTNLSHMCVYPKINPLYFILHQDYLKAKGWSNKHNTNQIFYPIFYWNTLSTLQKRKTTPILNVTSFKPLKSYYVLMEFLLTYCIEMTS